jgi:hypothetical protein
MPDTSSSRTLKVFLASPSDVEEERIALARLVRDINDVLTFLAPEKRLSLELVRYETHAYPDFGAPQDVINRQIPDDYDIFVGIMWKRCGTPTRSAPSGTIEEFRRACERRKNGHLPRILFYFCEQMIPIPDQEDLEQLAAVVKFRDEIVSLGLTWSYPTHADFSEHVRGGLLRGIRDVLLEESRTPEQRPSEVAERISSTAQAEVLALADRYEEIRREMAPGGARTRRMTEIFSTMKANAAGVLPLLPEFERSSSPGKRLAGIAILQMFPSVEDLGWLALRLDPEQEKPFVGYQAAVALLEAVRSLPVSACAELRAALSRATELAQRLTGDPDRLRVLNNADQELSRRCSSAAPL